MDEIWIYLSRGSLAVANSATTRLELEELELERRCMLLELLAAR